MKNVLEKHTVLPTHLHLSPALLRIHRGTGLALAWWGAPVPMGLSVPLLWLLTALGSLRKGKEVSAGVDGEFAACWSPWKNHTDVSSPALHLLMPCPWSH